MRRSKTKNAGRRSLRQPVCKKWWAYMKDLMPSNPDNSPVSRELKEVFHIELSQQDGVAAT